MTMRRTHWLVTLMVVASIDVSTMLAQSNCYEVAASIPLHFGRTLALASNGDKVYVLGENGLYAFQMNGTTPIYVGRNLERDYSFGRMAISADGRYVYVAADSLFIYDVSASAPELVLRMGIHNGIAADVKVSGNNLFVANPIASGGISPSGGVNIYSLSDPESPSLLSVARNTLNDYCSYFTVLAIQDDYLCAFPTGQGCGDPRLFVWNVGNPSNPQCIGNTKDLTNSPPRSLAAIGDWVFLLQDNGDLTACNDSIKSSPVWGRHGTGLGGNGMTIVGTNAYVAYADGIQVLDISDPGSDIPRLHEHKAGGAGFSAITSVGSSLVVGAPNSLSVFNGNLEKIGGNDMFLGNARKVIGDGSTAYVLDGAGGIKLIDIENQDQPELIAQEVTVSPALCYALGGNILYVGESGSRLQLYDVSNPQAPTRRGAAKLELLNTRNGGLMDAKPYFITAVGGFTYVGVVSHCCEPRDGGRRGVMVFDISNPDQPIERPDLFFETTGGFDATGASFNSVGQPTSFDVDPTGRYGYLHVQDYYWDNGVIGGTREYLVVRIEQDGSLVRMGSLGSDMLKDLRPHSTCVRNSIAYVTTQRTEGTSTLPSGANGILTMDIKTPDNPTINGFDPLGLKPLDVKVRGTDLFVASGDSMAVFDISASDGQPILHCSFATVDNANGLWVDDDGTVSVADGNFFTIYRSTRPSHVLDVLPDATEMDLSCRDRDTFHVRVRDRSGRPVVGQRVGVEDDLAGQTRESRPTDSTGTTLYPVHRNHRPAGLYNIRFIYAGVPGVAPVDRTVRIDSTALCDYVVSVKSDKAVYDLNDRIHLTVTVMRDGFPASNVGIAIRDPLAKFCAVTRTDDSGTATYQTWRRDSSSGYVGFGVIVADRNRAIDTLKYVVALAKAQPIADDRTVVATAPTDIVGIIGEIARQSKPITADDVLDVLVDATTETLTNPFVLGTAAGCVGGTLMVGTGVGAVVGAPLAAVTCPALVEMAIGGTIMTASQMASRKVIDHLGVDDSTKATLREIVDIAYQAANATMLVKGIGNTINNVDELTDFIVGSDNATFDSEMAFDLVSDLVDYRDLVLELDRGSSLTEGRATTITLNDTISALILTTNISGRSLPTDSSNRHDFTSLAFTYNIRTPHRAICISPPNNDTITLYSSVRLDWQGAQNATKYDIQVVTDSAILGRISEKDDPELLSEIYNINVMNVDSTFFTLRGLNPSSTYYWHVRGVDSVSGLKGRWSDAYQFTTPDTTTAVNDHAFPSAGTGDALWVESQSSGFSRLIYSTSEGRRINIAILDVRGIEILKVARSVLQDVGTHSYEFDMSGLPVGIYFCTVKSDDIYHVAKFIFP